MILSIFSYGFSVWFFRISTEQTRKEVLLSISFLNTDSIIHLHHHHRFIHQDMMFKKATTNEKKKWKDECCSFKTLPSIHQTTKEIFCCIKFNDNKNVHVIFFFSLVITWFYLLFINGFFFLSLFFFWIPYPIRITHQTLSDWPDKQMDIMSSSSLLQTRQDQNFMCVKI